MGPNHIIDNFIQPSAQNCCCDGLYCNSKLNMEKQNRFASMWEDFGKMNTHIFDDFEGMFPSSDSVVSLILTILNMWKRNNLISIKREFNECQI